VTGTGRVKVTAAGAINKQIDFSAQMLVSCLTSLFCRPAGTSRHSLPQAGLANRSLELPEQHMHLAYTPLLPDLSLQKE
jgi:hypothetical protein